MSYEIKTSESVGEETCTYSSVSLLEQFEKNSSELTRFSPAYLESNKSFNEALSSFGPEGHLKVLNWTLEMTGLIKECQIPLSKEQKNRGVLDLGKAISDATSLSQGLINSLEGLTTISEKAKRDKAYFLAEKIRNYGGKFVTTKERAELIEKGIFTQEEAEAVLRHGLVKWAKDGKDRSFKNDSEWNNAVYLTACNLLEEAHISKLQELMISHPLEAEEFVVEDPADKYMTDLIESTSESPLEVSEVETKECFEEEVELVEKKTELVKAEAGLVRAVTKLEKTEAELEEKRLGGLAEKHEKMEKELEGRLAKVYEGKEEEETVLPKIEPKSVDGRKGKERWNILGKLKKGVGSVVRRHYGILGIVGGLALGGVVIPSAISSIKDNISPSVNKSQDQSAEKTKEVSSKFTNITLSEPDLDFGKKIGRDDVSSFNGFIEGLVAKGLLNKDFSITDFNPQNPEHFALYQQIKAKEGSKFIDFVIASLKKDIITKTKENYNLETENGYLFMFNQPDWMRHYVDSLEEKRPADQRTPIQWGVPRDLVEYLNNLKEEFKKLEQNGNETDRQRLERELHGVTVMLNTGKKWQ